MNAGLDALAAHVRAFNDGVAGNGFDVMVARLTEGCVMTFVGVPAGPFAGRAAIAKAYAENPPDDAIVVLDATFTDDTATATYAWASAPARPAGRVTLALDGVSIAAVTIDYWAD